MRAALFASIVLFVLGSAACSSTTTPPEGDAGRDAGGSDSGANGDTGTGDAGSVDDAGASDAGDVDAGPDSGVRMPCTAAGACDPFDPTSCPDQACRASATGTMCADLSSRPVGEGGTCARDADCMPGLICLDFADGAGFVCYQMCADGSTGSCGDGQACTGTFGDTCIRACRPIPAPCDIYAQDCPDPADTCTFVRNPETSDPYTGCRPAGTQTEGQACGGGMGSCAHNLVCIASSGMNTCHQVCDPDVMPATCPSGQDCSGFARTWMVGFCQMPAP